MPAPRREYLADPDAGRVEIAAKKFKIKDKECALRF
jgi:hypothetical protein